MFDSVKPLVIVLAVATLTFYVGSRIASQSVSRRDFGVWRNCWFIVTTAAFLCTNFFAFAVVDAITCLYALSTRAAILPLYYLLLFAAPLVDVWISGLGGINNLLPLNHGRILSIVLFLPAFFALVRTGQHISKTFRAPDRLLLAYTLLLIILQMRQSELTNVVRVGVVDALDILVPYFAFSRGLATLSDLKKTFLAMLIAIAPLTLVALVEVAKSWHLYGGVVNDWGGVAVATRREGMLRAAGSADSGITLGYLFMVAIGCALPLLVRANPQRRVVVLSLIALSAGLVSTLSRGPWIGLGILIVAYLWTAADRLVNFAKLGVVGSILICFLLLTPSGKTVNALLPFGGSGEAEQTVTYRQRLFENSLLVIERNPWFGSSDYLATSEMRALVQGEGIIDRVNTYLQVALDSGLVGLGLFVGFFGTILLGLSRVMKFDRAIDPVISRYSRASFAILLGILGTIATTSSVGFVPYVYWSFAGLCVGLIRIAHAYRASRPMK